MIRGKKELRLAGEKTENRFELEYPLYEGIYKNALSSIFSRLLVWGKEEQAGMDYDNIIVFAGERGSGKTTALLIFCQKLSQNNQQLLEMLDDEEMMEECKKEQFRFYCLDMIELSMLEENEDIFELTLAKMLERMEEERLSDTKWTSANETTSQAAYRQLDKVYRSYNAVKYKRQMEEYGESTLSMLKNLSSSLDVKKAFADFLSGYFECISKDRKGKPILVIPFDDLDLNIEHGYEMLENIYRYMRQPNVIILLAVEPNQMEYICKNYILNASRIRSHHILNVSGLLRDSVRQQDEVEEHCEKLSKDYLKKMLPLDARMYMPDIRSDTIRVVERRIESNLEGKKEVLRSYSQKMFILGKYADKTGIYYDACGRKRHFCESDTIRTLVNYSYFLDSLKNIDLYEKEQSLEDWKRLTADFRENYENLYGDIVNRMASEMLSGNNKNIFEKLLQEDASRWGRFVYQHYLEFEEKENLRRDSAEEFSYCYGDLLKSIYYWGRYDGESKPLIHMMLALFSLKFTKEYIHYVLEQKEGTERKDGTEKSRHKDRLEGLLGRSMGGGWANELLPKIFTTGAVASVAYGYIPNVNMNQFVPNVFKLYVAERKGRSEFQELQSVLDGIKNTKLVERLEMIALFFTNIRDLEGKQADLTYHITCSRDMYAAAGGQEYQVVLQVGVENANLIADFDVFGLLQGIELDKTIQTLSDNIFCGIEKALKESYGQEVWGQEKAGQKLRGIQKKLGNRWKGWRDIVPIPYYNLDLTYNLFKRVRQKALREFPMSIGPKSSLKYIVDIYRMLGEELSQEVKKYEEIGKRAGAAVIRDNYLQYPLVKELLDGDKERADSFGQYMGNLVKAIAPLELIEAV